MIASISFDWSSIDRVKSFTREQYAQLREVLPAMDEWQEGKESAPPFYMHRDTLIDLATDGPTLAKLGLPFTVKRFKGAYFADKRPEAGSTVNIQIAIPAIGLLAMDEVMVLEDACTDILRGHLEDGWRIIAVCPPDAQRRPDYVLGRSSAGREGKR
ncbi:hypothetical protein [uncultured Alsobacter sp.]|uniref:hypothetical protein n=1 Tax=uncultured Alsobacter sp. TaxID=1748258 RepID=UPI002600D43F|nr:hypothetical protein [uncultured Alsobacter sp.]